MCWTSFPRICYARNSLKSHTSGEYQKLPLNHLDWFNQYSRSWRIGGQAWERFLEEIPKQQDTIPSDPHFHMSLTSNALFFVSFESPPEYWCSSFWPAQYRALAASMRTGWWISENTSVKLNSPWPFHHPCSWACCLRLICSLAMSVPIVNWLEMFLAPSVWLEER